MPTVKPIPPRDLMTLALILFIAALMRFGEPGVVEFRHDEAMLSLKALDWLDGGAFPVTGIPSSVGIPNPPISVYVMTLPYLLTNNPLLATLFVAALNVVGVGLLWLIARRYVGQLAALAAGLAYAVNPWAALYSRKIWAQDFHTPFFLLALLVGLYGFVESRRWAQVASLPLLIIALQIHFAAWALLPVYLWLLWTGRKRLSLPALAASLLLAALTLAPFAAGLRQTLGEDPERINDLIKRGEGVTLSADAFLTAVQFSTGLGMESVITPEQPDELLAAVPAQSQVWMLFGVLTALGILVLWTPTHRPVAVLVLLWAGFPVLVFSPTWTAFYPHYLIASIPALCLLTGIGLAWLTTKFPGKPISRTVALTALCVLLFSQAIWWRGLLRYIDSTDTPDGFGTPLHRLIDVRDQVANHSDLVLVSEGMEILYDQEPAVWSVLWRGEGRCLRAIDTDGLAVFPAGRFATVFALDTPPDAAQGVYASGQQREIPLRPDEGVYAVRMFDTPPAWTGALLITLTPARFANGARLTGYALTDGQVALQWQVPAQENADYHYFAHLLDTSGEKLAQRDDAFLPGRFWCSSDHVVTWADIDPPDSAVTLRVGMYTLERGAPVNSPVLDEDGNAVASWVDIGLRTED